MARETSIFDDHQLFLFLGLAAFIFAGMMVLVATIVLFTGSPSPLGGMCTVGIAMLVVGGTICTYLGLRGRRGHRRLERVADLLRAYRRIEINVLAQKLGVSPMDAEYTIAECIGKGLVEGYFDRQEGEFFTKDALWQVMEIDSCPKCGAPMDDLYLVGEEVHCKYCGSIAIARGSKEPASED